MLNWLGSVPEPYKDDSKDAPKRSIDWVDPPEALKRHHKGSVLKKINRSGGAVNYIKKYTNIEDNEELAELLGTVAGLREFFFNETVLSKLLNQTPEGSLIGYTRDAEIRLGVRLVLVHTNIWRYLATPLANAVSGCMAEHISFGLVHAAVQVGPFLIDWTSDGLVCPRRLKSSSPLLVASPTDNVIVSTPNTLNKLCAKLVEWNADRQYSYFQKGDAGNCHVFVRELLEALSIKLHFSPAVERFLGELKNNQFEMAVETERGRTVFTSHAQLDEFTRAYMEEQGITNPNTWKDESGVLDLLKAFDRAFSLGCALTPDKDTPASPQNCPFHKEEDLQNFRPSEYHNEDS